MILNMRYFKTPLLILFLAILTGMVLLLGYFILANKQVNKVYSQELKVLGSRLDSMEKILKEELGKPSVVKEEIIRREIVKEKSQEEQLTSAVAKVAPAVVSIVVTKDVPKLEVIYVNPFGDDPFFDDVGIRVPMYRQRGTEQQKVGAGTGFIVENNGYIMTNKHVVADENATYTVLLSNGEQRVAKVVYRDSQLDLAVIKIEGSNYTKVELGNSASLKLGQSVFVVGNAFGEYSNSVSVGIVSGLNRNIQAQDGRKVENLSGVIQTDAAINPGNSGGPLVDLEGKVVGINVATVLGSQSIGFSIPVDQAKQILNSVIK